MRILFVTSSQPFPPRHGAILPAAEAIRVLAEDHAVTLAFFQGPSRQAPSGVTELRLPVASRLRATFDSARHARALVPRGIAPFWSQRAARALNEHALKNEIEYLIVHRLHAAFASRELDLPSVLIGQDLFSAKTHQTVRPDGVAPRLVANALSRLYERCERQSFRWFDRCTFVTEDEAQAARVLDPACKIEVVHNGADHNHATAEWHPDRLSKRRIGYFGNLDSRRNRRALDYLVEQLLPSLRAIDKRYELAVIGAGGQDLQQLRQADGVRWMGYVDDPSVELARCSIMVNPQAESSGIKNSVLAGMVCGVPTVVSQSIANGLPSSSRSTVAIANTTAEYVRLIEELVHDRGGALVMSVAAKLLVSEQLTWRSYVRATLQC